MMADDMGYSDIGCYGGEIETPNLDRLASEGIRVTQFMNNSKSAPTRASLLTGIHAIEAGCSGAPAQMVNSLTFAELLKTAGYNTWMTGKWHAKEHPVARGFDHFYGCCSGASNYFEPKKNSPFMRDGERIDPITEENRNSYYTTDTYTSEAIDLLERYRNDPTPFLLYVGYNAPHYPLQAWQEDIDKYRGKYMVGWDEIRRQRFERQRKMGIVPPSAKLSDREPDVPAWESFEAKEAAEITMATYAAMVDRLDQNIGRLLSKLEEIGKSDETIVIFLSDNGANTEGEMWDGIDPKGSPDLRTSQAKQGGEWANASNTPFRRYKRHTHNGGIVTPFIVRWSGSKLKPGTILHKPAHIVDIYPTFAELAGAKHPEGEQWNIEPQKGLKSSWEVAPLSGVSLLPMIERGEDLAREYIMGYFQGARVVRSGDWKAVSDGGDGTVQHMYDYEWELYNISKDPAECNNVVAKNPKIIQRLDKAYREWITYAEQLGGVRDHQWYVVRFTDEQRSIAKEMEQDRELYRLLTTRKEIGEQIVDEINSLKLKIKRGLGMWQVPMSYFGLVEQGRKYAKDHESLNSLYAKWDANIEESARHCASLGAEFAEVWRLQEHIRPNMPNIDIE